MAQEVTVTPYHTFRMEGAPAAVTFSGDGRLLLAGDESGRVVGWDVEQKTRRFQLRLRDEVVFLGMLDGGEAFVSVDQGGHIAIRPTSGGDAEERFQTESAPRRAALDAGRRYLAVLTRDDRIALFDLQAGMRLGVIDAQDELDDEVLFLGFDRLGEQLVAITRRGTVLSWNPVTLRLIRKLALSGGTLHGARTAIQAAAAHRAGEVFAVALQEVALPKGGLRGRARPGDLVRRNVIIAYDWDSGIEIKRIPYPAGAPAHLGLGPGSDHVAVSSREGGEVALVDLREGERQRTLTVPEAPAVLAVSEDDRWLAVGTEAGRIALYALRIPTPSTAELETSALPTLSGRIRILSDETPLIAPNARLQLAVLPFQGGEDYENIAQLAQDVLTTRLANIVALTLLERARIDEVIGELELQASGLTESDGAQIGHLLNADYVVMGSVRALGTTYLFTARLLKVETAEVVGARQVICEACRFEDVFDAIRLLSTTLAQ